MAVAVLVATAPALAGCGKQSILSTRSPQAHNIMLLWWWMLAAAAIVFFGAVAMLVIAWIRRGTPGLPWFGEREEVSEGMVLLFGIGIPVVALVALFGVANIYLIKQTSPPSPKSTAMTINVIGHQWWWEVRYGSPTHPDAVTANEIHIPTDTRVNVVATTADVIHSFWVPALNRKIDMIPGRQNRVLLYASRPGRYRGQCSQFCGLQHANMAMYVFAQKPAAFRSWLANMASRARSTSTGQIAAGKQLFMSSQCASCHRIAGTQAQGTVGPDLTHLATRTSLASVTIPNTPAYLKAWVANPQAIKPGARMPDLGLSPGEVSQLVAYLESLK
ncbi:MAG TPA: cytochrome c oxidase subunit II [Solirubrobacteraceae bacterium]|nr:cytochrome c oxidase subunit II [Solirubrobacteraceae bacterium]